MSQEKTALIIDNDQIHGKGVATALKDIFSAIYSTTNPYDAFQVLQQQPVDIIFAELNLAVIDGIEMIKMIKKCSNSSIIIIWSANLNTDLVLEVKELGVSDFFEKPFNLQVFKERILNII